MPCGGGGGNNRGALLGFSSGGLARMEVSPADADRHLISSIPQHPTPQASAAASRLVTQLGQCLDDITSSAPPPRLLVVGATNRPHGVHPSLRRPGRLDKEVRGGAG